MDTTNYHFFASHIGGWGCGDSVNEAIENALYSVRKGLGQDKHRLAIEVWFVPTDRAASYSINFFAPQVEGAFPIAVFMYNKHKLDLPTEEENEKYGFKFGGTVPATA